jgi:hypothetical protein
LQQLDTFKREADRHAAQLAAQRARENAQLAAVEAAAAAEEWEKVYALRVEREEADRRAAEAQRRMQEAEAQVAAR